MLAVFTVEEVLAIRATGVRTPVLVFLGAVDRAEAEAAIAAQATPVVWDLEGARLVDAAAAAAGRPAPGDFKMGPGPPPARAPTARAAAPDRAGPEPRHN